MAIRKRLVGAGKILLLIGALAGTYAVFAAVAMRFALRAREVAVPNLMDRTANEATAIASAAGLTVRVDTNRRADPKVAAGHVMAQDPEAGVTSRQQRSIRIWLSAGPRATIVPQLTGESERTAQLKLAQDGLTSVDVSEIRSQSYASDVVVAQDPLPNHTGAHVALLINRGEHGASYVMPDLIGVAGDRAADTLRGHGFRVAVVGAAPYPGVPPGIVIRQNPAGGFQIAPGEPISLEVSR
jgi:serine/threonine-protein kinase